MIPQTGTSKTQGGETNEEIDYGFSGLAHSSSNKVIESMEWIIDSGASDHMTSSLKNLVNVKLAPSTFTITLPTGATAVITHVGDVTLPNGMQLKNVLHVPQFNHNLLSIHKLAKDSNCNVVFQPESCVIMNSVSNNVVGIGRMKRSLYYLENEKLCSNVVTETRQKSQKEPNDRKKGLKTGHEFTIWHQRLGHAPISKMQRIN